MAGWGGQQPGIVPVSKAAAMRVPVVLVRRTRRAFTEAASMLVCRLGW
jgi:hypothetical protein